MHGVQPRSPAGPAAIEHRLLPSYRGSAKPSTVGNRGANVYSFCSRVLPSVRLKHTDSVSVIITHCAAEAHSLHECSVRHFQTNGCLLHSSVFFRQGPATCCFKWQLPYMALNTFQASVVKLAQAGADRGAKEAYKI